VLVRAGSQAEAEAQLVRAFAAQEAPYLNEAGYLVRWHFECFTGCYDLGVHTGDDFLRAEGVEVFSSLHRRRLRPELEWHPAGPLPGTGEA
jgi:hypothetical protein